MLELEYEFYAAPSTIYYRFVAKWPNSRKLLGRSRSILPTSDENTT